MDWDDAYANGKYIPDAGSYPARWASEAAAFRADLGPRARLGLAYGAGARQWFDLFLPQGQPRGLMLFVHGGYWLAFGPRDWSHLAAGALAQGFAVAMPGYTLAPAARIGAMVREVAVALVAAAAQVAGPIVVCGHSAGGHLAARLACADVLLPVARRLQRVVPISPLADLRPLMRTSMTLGLDAAEAMAESPALQKLRPGVAVSVWVGGQERPVFLDQAGWLGTAWDVPVIIEPGRHHFDVIDGLKQPDSPLTTALLAGV